MIRIDKIEITNNATLPLNDYNGAVAVVVK